MAAVSRKRKRTALDIHQKQDIISYYDSKPKTHQQIADHFPTLWSTEVKRRTVGDIISHREKWLAVNTSLPGAKRVKLAMHGDLEDVLWLWFVNKRVQNVVLSDEVVHQSINHDLDSNPQFEGSQQSCITTATSEQTREF